jgi:hypothetical protein
MRTAEMGEMVSPFSGGCSMRTFIQTIPVFLLISVSVSAQSVGMYNGVSSQGQAIQFRVTTQGDLLCVDQVGFAVSLTCPSGVRPGWSSAYFPCSSIQDDGSFTISNPAVDGAILGYAVNGQFTSDTTVEGDIDFRASHLRVEGGKILEAQLCDSAGVTFTASFSGGAGEPLRFEGNEIVRTTAAGNTSTLYRLDTK